MEKLISKHKYSDNKKNALKNLKPGMSYQQARIFYGVNGEMLTNCNYDVDDDNVSQGISLGMHVA